MDTLDTHDLWNACTDIEADDSTMPLNVNDKPDGRRRKSGFTVLGDDSPFHTSLAKYAYPGFQYGPLKPRTTE